MLWMGKSIVEMIQ